MHQDLNLLASPMHHSLTVFALFIAVVAGHARATNPVQWAEIRVVDQETGLGVPLVELETVNSLVLVTDNAEIGRAHV